MTDDVVEVREMGKRYRLNEGAFGYDTLREALTRTFTRPIRPASRPRDLWALRDIDFTVAHGEIVGVVGRNGAGKTTLLKILCRITQPTEGLSRTRGRV